MAGLSGHVGASTPEDQAAEEAGASISSSATPATEVVEGLMPLPEPEPEPVVIERGRASWYGPGFQGRRTANGERFDMHALTAAHRTLPFGTLLRVQSMVTGLSVEVRINDRGPYTAGLIIDLSRAAALAIGLGAQGVKEVELAIADPVEAELALALLAEEASKPQRVAPVRRANRAVRRTRR